MNIEDGEQAQPAGGSDGTEIKKDQEDVNAQPQPGDESNPDGGGANQEGGEETGGMEEEGGSQEEGTEPQPGVDLQKLEENLLSKIDERLKQNQPPPPQRELTEEEWAKHEAEWGIPRQTITQVAQQSVKVFNKAKDYIDSELGAIKKDMAMSGLSKEPGFADVSRLRGGMEEFLKDYDPRHHSNPVLLKKAAIYARGLEANKNVNRARQTNERNMKVAGRIRPGKSEGGSVKSGGSFKSLTPQEREAAEMMEGGEAEYMKIKNGKQKFSVW